MTRHAWAVGKGSMHVTGAATSLDAVQIKQSKKLVQMVAAPSTCD